MRFLKIYGITFIVFLIIDMLWLGVFAKDLYQKHIGFLLAPNPRWGFAIMFYIIYIVGLVFFVLSPALEKQSIAYAMAAGALFNFVAYATYDLTNIATLYSWPLTITVIDLIWGTFLGFSVSSISFMICRYLKL